MTRQPEGRTTAKIRKWLTEHGAAVYNIHVSDFQAAGTPDLLCCWYGNFVGIEVKQPGEQPSKAQRHQLRRIVEAGGIAIVAEKLEDVTDVLLGVRV